MRLISFVGTGNYGETTYSFEGKTCCTKYVAHALATFIQPREIHLIATVEAWDQHGASLSTILTSAGLPAPRRISVPTGGEPENLWKMFSEIVESIRTSSNSVLLDITHGFRMQPFFAAACIQYIQAVIPNPPAIRVVYGEYRKGEPTSPIWELTPFLDVLSWSRDLMMFLRTGQAEAVVEPTKRLASDLRRQWAASGRQKTQPKLQMLSKALQDFSDDFTTVRTGSLLLGDRSSAAKLSIAIEETKSEVSQHLPALALILDQVSDMLQPLKNECRLSSTKGQQQLLALARIYERMGRFSEAISILREGWITLRAPETADVPGGPVFDSTEREKCEEAWQKNTTEARSVSQIRNDIQHAGFRKTPLKKETLKEQLLTLLAAWESAIIDSEPPE